jgi:DNA-binding transcriptional regulator LsrR (DeoR family)
MEDQHIELLVRVASFYYEDNYKQDEIATRIGYSRSMVSRLLNEAREKGVVDVQINYPMSRCNDLEKALQKALNLRMVRVMARGTLGNSQMLRKLGAMSARLVDELIGEGARNIGISWGTALWETVSAMRKANYPDTRIFQIIGSSGSVNPEIDGPNLARYLAEALGGQYFTIPAPLIVESPATREALRQDPAVARIMQATVSLDLALVGIGSMDPESSSWIRSGHMDRENIRSLAMQGVVGDVCGIIFDRNGHLPGHSIQNRVVGIGAEDLKRIPLKLGISAGGMKTLPILGACRAGLVNCLITDEVAALGVLEFIQQDTKQHAALMG